MSKPEESPLPAPLTPPQKQCPDCGGSGNKPLKFLGARTDPCPSCAGTGTIEVAEEPFSPWQQQIESRLKKVEEWVLLQQPLGTRPDPPADLKPMDFFEAVNP